jgi:polyhydroxybutyrate depolymerase
MLRIGMNAVAEKEAFLVAYPNGTGLGLGLLNWNAGGATPMVYAEQKGVDDIGFIRRMLAVIGESYKVDDRRIYATGFSKGGMLAYRLACEMSDQIAAIAPVAATQQVEECRPDHGVAILHVHGTADENVPLKGGKGRHTAKKAYYRAVHEVLDSWRTRNSCDSETVTTHKAGNVVCRQYKGCKGNADVAFCLVEGGGHGWHGPGIEPTVAQKKRGDRLNQDMDLSRMIWEFFKKHPRMQSSSR